MKKLLLILFAIILLLPFTGRADNDCCEKDAIRILEQFHTTFRAKCIQLVKDSLNSMLPRNKEFQRDIKIKEFDFDKFEYKIANPVLKLKKEARDYKEGDNICSLFDFDTVYYSCDVGLFVDTALVFYCNMQFGDYLVPGAEPHVPKFEFSYVYYDIDHDSNKIEYYNHYGRLGKWGEQRYGYDEVKSYFTSDNQLDFEICGLSSNCIIKNNRIYIQLLPYTTDPNYQAETYVCLDYYCTNYISPEGIRSWVETCPAYKPSPWWHFWDWDIFH